MGLTIKRKWFDGVPVLAFGQVLNKLLGLVREGLLAISLNISYTGSLFFSLKGTSDLITTFMNPNSILGLIVGRSSDLDDHAILNAFARQAQIIAFCSFIAGLFIGGFNGSFKELGVVATVGSSLILSVNLYLLVFYSIILGVIQLRREFLKLAALGVGAGFLMVVSFSFLPKNPPLLLLSFSYLFPTSIIFLVAGRVVFGRWALPPLFRQNKLDKIISIEEVEKILLGSIPLLWIGFTKAVLGAKPINSLFTYSVMLVFSCNSLLMEPLSIVFGGHFYAAKANDKTRLFRRTILYVFCIGLLGVIGINFLGPMVLNWLLPRLHFKANQSVDLIKLVVRLSYILPFLGITQVANVRQVQKIRIGSYYKIAPVIGFLFLIVCLIISPNLVGIPLGATILFLSAAAPAIIELFRKEQV